MSFSNDNIPTKEKGIYLHEPRSDPECQILECETECFSECSKDNYLLLLLILFLFGESSEHSGDSCNT